MFSNNDTLASVGKKNPVVTSGTLQYGGRTSTRNHTLLIILIIITLSLISGIAYVFIRTNVQSPTAQLEPSEATDNLAITNTDQITVNDALEVASNGEIHDLLLTGKLRVNGTTNLENGLQVIGDANIDGDITANNFTADNIVASSITVDSINVGQIDGLDLSNLNANDITQGTLSDARLSSNVALLNRSSQIFSGNNTFQSSIAVQGSASFSNLSLSSTLNGTNAIFTGGASFGATVSGANAVSSNDFVTLQQVGAIIGSPFLQNGNVFGTVATLGTNDAQDLRLITNGVESIRITASGNVGIGTTTPLATLEILPNADIATLALRQYAGQTANILEWYNSSGVILGRINDGGEIRGVSGTKYTPAYSFDGDSNTGIYRPLADTIKLSTGGNQGFTFDANQNVAINSFNVSDAKLEVGDATLTSIDGINDLAVADDAEIDGDLYVDGDANIASTLTVANGADFTLGTVNFHRVYISANGIFPTQNLARNLGGSSLRWSEIYGGLGNFSSTVDVGGLLTASSGINVNAETLTDLTGIGLVNNLGVLEVDNSSANGFFQQGGNSFGTTAVLGTNDIQALSFETNGTTRCTIASTGGLSCPGVGSNSELFGSGASAGGANGIAIGRSANSGTGSNNVIIGYNSGLTVSNGAHVVAIGANSLVHTSSAVVIGSNAQSTSNATVAVGHSASSGNRAVAIGSSASATTYSLAIGQLATANNLSSIVLGSGASSTANNQLIVGGSSTTITQAFFGEGVTSATPGDFTLNVTGGSGTDIAGADLLFAGGRGTGAGAGGEIIFQTATASGSSGSSLNTLSERLRVTEDNRVIGGASTLLQFQNNNDGHIIGQLNVDYQSSANPIIAGSGGSIYWSGLLMASSNGSNIEARSTKSNDLIFTHNRAGDYGIQVVTQNNAGDTGLPRFRVGGGDASSAVAYFNNLNGVGIGTITPNYLLDVNDDIGVYGSLQFTRPSSNVFRAGIVWDDGSSGAGSLISHSYLDSSTAFGQSWLFNAYQSGSGSIQNLKRIRNNYHPVRVTTDYHRGSLFEIMHGAYGGAADSDITRAGRLTSR